MSEQPSTPLLQRRCVPCEAGTPPLTRQQAEALVAQVSSRWKLAQDARSLERRIVFRDFRSAMDFLVQLADLAEEEGHHPDFCCSYRTVDLRLTTHAIGGLSENDFILAAKIDELLRRRQEARRAEQPSPSQ